jgi:hypothetical protein
MVNARAGDGSAGWQMDVRTALPEIGADDFARRFSLRSSNLMWLLGAGTSASAGIPTAGDMIWEFKQTLFVTQRDDMSCPYRTVPPLCRSRTAAPGS